MLYFCFVSVTQNHLYLDIQVIFQEGGAVRKFMYEYIFVVWRIVKRNALHLKMYVIANSFLYEYLNIFPVFFFQILILFLKKSRGGWCLVCPPPSLDIYRDRIKFNCSYARLRICYFRYSSFSRCRNISLKLQCCLLYNSSKWKSVKWSQESRWPRILSSSIYSLLRIPIRQWLLRIFIRMLDLLI